MTALACAAPTTGTCTCATARRCAPCCPSPRRASRARIVMPNLKPPVTTTALRSAQYRERILAALPAGLELRAADDAVPDRPHAAGRRSHARARQRLRLRRQAVSGRRDDAFRRRRHRHRARRRGARGAWPSAAWRCRCTARSRDRVDVFDREARFIDACWRRWSRATRDCASCSSTSRRARPCEFVRGARAGVAATITPQHLLLNRNAMFDGRHPPAPLLPAGAEARARPRGAARGGHRRRSALLPRHRQRAARAPHQGNCLRLRRHLLRARRHRALRRGVRRGRLAGRGSRASRPSFGADFYGLPRNAGHDHAAAAPGRRAREYPFGDEELVPMRAGGTRRLAAGRRSERRRTVAHRAPLPRLPAGGRGRRDRRLQRRARMRCSRSPR